MSRLKRLSITFAFAAAVSSSVAYADGATTPPPKPGGAATPAAGAATPAAAAATPAAGAATPSPDPKAADSAKPVEASVTVSTPEKKPCKPIAAPTPGADLKIDDPADCAKAGDDLDGPGKDELDLAKKKDGSEWFIGVRYRDFIVPNFFFSLFASGGPSDVNIASVGPEMTYRSGNLEVDVALTYADFSMKPFLFKNKTQQVEAYEIVSSDIKVFTGLVDILGNIPLDKQRRFSILIGAGIGVGGVAGNLYRNQAYPVGKNTTTPDPTKTSNFAKCVAPGNPNVNGPDGPYCDSSNTHYGNYTEPSWAHSGSKPNVWPYVAPIELAFRVQPIKLLQLRLDTGFSLNGFILGGAAGIKLPI